VGYKGKIKLHGCNGAITISADSTLRVQSRNRSVPPLLLRFFFTNPCACAVRVFRVPCACGECTGPRRACCWCFLFLLATWLALTRVSWPAAQVHRRGEQGPGQVGQSQHRLLRVAVASRTVLPAARLWGVGHVAHRLRRVVRTRRAERRNVFVSHISHRRVQTLILSVRVVRAVRVMLLAVCRAVPSQSEVAIGKLDKCIFAVFSLYIDNHLMIEPDDIKTLLGGTASRVVSCRVVSCRVVSSVVCRMRRARYLHIRRSLQPARWDARHPVGIRLHAPPPGRRAAAGGTLAVNSTCNLRVGSHSLLPVPTDAGPTAQDQRHRGRGGQVRPLGLPGVQHQGTR